MKELDRATQVLEDIKQGSYRALAQGISWVENNLTGYEELLMRLDGTQNAKVVGITGPPGAGKSTLVNSLLHYWTNTGKKVAVIAVDPSSPFNYGALLGDRIRMSEFYTNPNVYIRSLATRGSLGGLNPKIIEITDIVRSAPFDYILIETVGVGQSEVEIAGLADCTIVALVPEAGDEVQTLKAGIMEIADIFVVNKADREAADTLYRNLRIMAHERAGTKTETPVIKTIATQKQGIEELAGAIQTFLDTQNELPQKRLHLLTEKSWLLIQQYKMQGIDRRLLTNAIKDALTLPDFNLYSFTNSYIHKMEQYGG
ncbi:MAG: transporter [Bacteroidetes bacterium 43-93]|nr:methylmalonyl Co-A mutase-associated GTPase MeaB [Bacteroidota bacterium]OJX01584.1 MAG: transporter [Bacteroidetes bacterium 43-93]